LGPGWSPVPGSHLEGQASRGHQVARLRGGPDPCRRPVRRCRSCGLRRPLRTRAGRPPPSPLRRGAPAALGHAPYLSGRSAEARPPLEELVARVSAAEQPSAVLTGPAVLLLLAGGPADA